MVMNNSAPTPRECKGILDRVSNDGICWCVSPDSYHPLGHDSACRDARILFSRLTDEALTKDEARRAALEALWAATEKDGEGFTTDYKPQIITVHEEFQNAYFTLKAMDALAPTPQEGKPNYDAQRKYLNSIVNTAWDERRVAWLESIRKECLALGLEKTHPKLAKFLSEVEFCTPAPEGKS